MDSWKVLEGHVQRGETLCYGGGFMGEFLNRISIEIHSIKKMNSELIC